MPIVLWAVLWAAIAPSRSEGQQSVSLLPDNVMGGWTVFVQKRCVECHAVWDIGGQIGPDLGRTEQQNLTVGRLAGCMWNHIPKVYSHALRNQVEYPHLSRKEMSDLFSFLFFVRYLDEPGDPDAGLRAMREKGCATCHSTEGLPRQPAPDLKRWAGYANPIVWAQKMWEHAPQMEQAMKRAGMAWPQLDDTDLVNIMAYLRSVGGHESKVYLMPGSPKAGAELFAERNCRTCHHPGGPGEDLATATLPRSLAALASRMWNHSPEMTRMMQARGVERSTLTAQEMADIIAYIISLRFDDRGGDPRRGRTIFEKKRCAQCHPAEKTADSIAPPLESVAAAVGPVRLAHAMWNHGVPMMNKMSEAGAAWPVFESSEMVDLIAYLKSIAPIEETVAVVGQLPTPTRTTPQILTPPPIIAGASCVSNACHPGIIAGREVHAPAAQGECNTCHVLVDPVAHHFELLSADSDLCYACHDEPVPPLQIHGPVGVGICTTCHNPHSAENLFGPNFTGDEVCFADMIGMTATLETLVEGELLIEQEPTATPVPKEARAPVTEREPVPDSSWPAAPTDKRPSAVPISALPIAPSVSGPDTINGGCVTSECHASTVSNQFVHGPTAQQQCEYCHVLIDEQNHRFRLAAKEPDLCFECHYLPMEGKFKHGPVALGLCTPCHDPHSAPHKFMLPEAGSELCFMCHSELGEQVHSARVQHGVIKEEGCTVCHDPHHGDIKFQLKKDMPELCMDCHEPIRAIIETTAVAHEPVATGKTCGNCHNPHGSDVPGILTDVESNLCLGCHDHPMETPNGPIIDMKSWIENNPEHHGPVRDGNCSGCHEPHGSKNFRILRQTFPRKFYSPFSLETYALCFECHEETLVLDERTTTLTGFRNGDKNLHYVHVNQEKGRTCRACHEIHAGTKPNRIKDFVPFGRWNFPVNFEKSEHGGSCAPGCHAEWAYDRRWEIVQD